MQLLTNSFQLPADGWYQISSLGEFPHNPTGLVQIVDEASCRSMVDSFHAAAQQPNFAGLLIDFDHFSLERDKPSEAAGWITSLEQRPDGLWAQIRWSDSGQQAVTGGRYRFISPVWKQDECEMLGNNRVRPLKLVNAAVTNDPNIRGMIPLSNRAVPPVAEPAKPRAPVLSNRLACNFARGVALATRDLYITPRGGLLRNSGPMTDEQRKAMFARLRGGGSGGRGGSRGEPGPSGDSSAGGVDNSPSSADATLDSLSQGYDAGPSETSHIRPLNEPPPSQSQDTAAITYDPIRASDERIKAIEGQRDALIAQRPVEPKKSDFTLVDTRKLESELRAKGMGTNEVAAAVKAAQAQNIARKAALHRIKKEIADAFPNNGAKQAQALSKYMQQLDAQYQKQHDAWQKVSDKIDAAVAKANQMIADEKARGTEDAKLAQQKTKNAAATSAQKAADKKSRAIQKQVDADKAEARRKTASAAKTKTAAPPKTADDLTAHRREMTRRQFYWDSLSRGEVHAAKMLYPKADTDADLQTLKELAPKSRSKSNDKAHKSALAELAKQPPASPLAEVIP